MAGTKLALLIDGDNISPGYMPLIMREASKHGALAIRRVYGQFKSGKMKSWMKHVDEFDLTPVDVSPLTRGKNATDLKLAIEAMDMLYGRQLDGVCIASSDGDFTPLAARLRTNALAVIGFGAKKAPAAYKAEFDRFYECDTLLAEKKNAHPPRPAPTVQQVPAPDTAKTAAMGARGSRSPAGQVASATPARRRTIPSDVAERIRTTVEREEKAHGPIDLRSLGNILVREIPGFQVRKYGHANTRALLRDVPGLEITSTDGGKLRVRSKPT